MKKVYKYRRREYTVTNEGKPFGVAYTANGWPVHSLDFDHCDDDEHPEMMREARRNIERAVTRGEEREKDLICIIKEDEKMKHFEVETMECNANIFASNYSEYITARRTGFCGLQIFTLTAPENIYNEIADLHEEGIDIVF